MKIKLTPLAIVYICLLIVSSTTGAPDNERSKLWCVNLTSFFYIAFYQNSKQQPFCWEIIQLSQLSSRLLLIHLIWRWVIHFSIQTWLISYIEKVICLSYLSWKRTKKFNCKNSSNEDLRYKKWQPTVWNLKMQINNHVVSLKV